MTGRHRYRATGRHRARAHRHDWQPPVRTGGGWSIYRCRTCPCWDIG